jgi:pyruvate/2-oxoglutarate dehydrogenase complex dihydrolipoamide dehydrogenase (E3) component
MAVEVAGARYTARYVLVATGGRPNLPAVRGVELAITSDEALSLPSLPRRLAVVGGGYIGVELAGVFNAAGVEVTMLIRGDTLLRGFDDDVRAMLTAELGKRGVVIRCDTVVSDIERRGSGINLLTRVDYEYVPSAVFSQPPVGTVGYTEREARARFGVVDVYVQSFQPMKHALSGRDERTMMKLVVAREGGRVVGCHVVGAEAPEIVQGFAVAIRCGATKAIFDTTVGIHPTAAEELVTMREKRPDSGAKGVKGEDC